MMEVCRCRDVYLPETSPGQSQPFVSTQAFKEVSGQVFKRLANSRVQSVSLSRARGERLRFLGFEVWLLIISVHDALTAFLRTVMIENYFEQTIRQFDTTINCERFCCRFDASEAVK